MLNEIQTISDAFWTAVLPQFQAGTVHIEGRDRWENFLKELYRAPGDDPVVSFDYITQSKKPATRTFGQNRTTDAGGYRIAERFVFNINIKSKKVGTDAVSDVWGRISKGLFSVYPNLGITAFTVSDFQLEAGAVRTLRGSNLIVPMTIFCRPTKEQVTA